jgi:arylsulfatase A-like enzyme
VTCPACGSPAAETQRFCGTCGAALPRSDSPTATSPLIRPEVVRAPAGSERFLPGQILANRYRMVGPLGRGGMGEVYRADDLKLGQPVALKFLPRDVERDPERLERFLAEVRLSLRVTHPNVCRVFDIDDVDGRHFLSMEYVDGEDLASLLRRIGRLPEDKAVEIARQLCAGLAAAHEAGVLHRDLKPSNVMIDGRGRAKITDFGLASATSGVAGREARVGTPQYMAPEQLDGRELSVRTDVYSLGLVLYELFTGKRACASTDALGMVAERASTPTSPAAHVTGLNPIVERAILRCLQPNPADRPSSVEALAAALPGGDPLAMAMAAGETPSPEMVARAGGRGELEPAIAIACLAVVIIGLIAAWISHGANDLHNRVPLPTPPAELRGAARAAIAAAGYTSVPGSAASGFSTDTDYLRHIEATDQSSTRWRALATVDPAPLWFWYRESPRPMAPLSNFLNLNANNPPMVEPGMVRVRLDPRGRLQELLVVPPDRDSADGAATGREPDWSPLMTAAGIMLKDWTTAAPQWTPPVASDVRRAWTRADLRLEAAAVHGKPVWFRVIPPWRRPAEVRINQPAAAASASAWTFQGALIAVIIAAILLAVRHIRQGRSDRRRATRLAFVYFGLGAIYWLTRIGGDPSSWVSVFQNNIAGELYVAGLIWLFYVALEPYVRRLWPRTLIAWTRLFEGKLRDPMVGRHLLLGAVAGMAMEVVFQVPRIASLFGGPEPTPLYDLFPLTSARARLGAAAFTLQDSFVTPVASLIFVLVCRVVFRRTWLAYAAASAITLVWFGLDQPAPQVAMAAVAIVTVLVILTRLGLLALCVAIAFSNWPHYGLTTDPGSWFFFESVLTMLGFAALAMYGFVVSLGSQRVFKQSLLVVALLAGVLTSCAPTPPARPNIVFILVDDMRWDDFRAGGHPFIETPNIDRLAREGARFLNAFATTPLCSPSRASLLTGQYARTHGIIDNTARPSHDLPVFPLELQRAGYQTGFFGKWHMGNDDSPRRGFTRWVAMPGQGEAVDPHLNVDGQKTQAKGYVTDVLTDHVETFIRGAGSSPFVVYLAHKAIHPNVIQRDDGKVVPLADQPGGFVAAERHRGRYAGKTMPRRPNAFKPPVDKPALMRTIGTLPPLGRETATTDEEIRGRIEMMLAVDESLGRIMTALERAGTLDNTVIVFTSDHGYFYGEHGLNEERRLAYEETIRIPLLVRYPSRVTAGSTPGEMALTIDLAPTLLALAGLTPPKTMDGRSLVPLFEKAPADWRKSFLVEYYSDTVFPRIVNMGYSAVRTDRYKYIQYRELKRMDELYDLESDPYEEHNLIASPTAAPLLETMRAQLTSVVR